MERNIASKIAVETVDEFISSNRGKIDKVVFNLWSDEDVMIYEQNIYIMLILVERELNIIKEYMT